MNISQYLLPGSSSIRQQGMQRTTTITSENVASWHTRHHSKSSHKEKEVGVAETEKPEREDAAMERTGKDESHRRDATGSRDCL